MELLGPSLQKMFNGNSSPPDPTYIIFLDLPRVYIRNRHLFSILGGWFIKLKVSKVLFRFLEIVSDSKQDEHFGVSMIAEVQRASAIAIQKR